MLDPEFCIFDGGPVSDKLDYILTRVYPQTRNPANWLDFEFKYRQLLNDQIKFAHTNFDAGWRDRMGQFDSKFNYFSYPTDHDAILKFHQTLVPYAITREVLAHERSQAEEYVQEYGGLLINSEELFTPDLPKPLYDKIYTFGNFTDCYESAKLIHTAWWDCRNRSRRQGMPIPAVLCPYVISEIT